MDHSVLNLSPNRSSQGTITLILGGVRSGKSSFGERLAQELGGDSVLYVATAEARDDEMVQRIRRHRESRPSAWQTLECPVNVRAAIDSQQKGTNVVLLDCLTLLVSNLLCTVEIDSSATKLPADQIDRVQEQINVELDAILQITQTTPCHLILVSGEVGLGLVPENPLGRAFRDLLGWANQRIARQATATYFMVAGLPIEVNAIASGLHSAAQKLRDQVQRTGE